MRRLKKIVLWGGGALLAALIVFHLLAQRLPEHLAPATDYGVVPLLSVARADTEVPSSDTARALLVHLSEIEASTVSSRYAHRTDVDPHAGRYHWDCSGMVGWLLRRHAPRSFSRLGRERPVAADFARLIARSNTEPVASGWQRIARIEDVEAGDVFAWRSPPELRSENSTGHVGIVLGAPRRAVSWGDVWSVRIADSTTVPHEDDSRLERADRDGGLGIGVMTFVVDEDRAVTHYGWAGSLSPIYVRADVVFGRPHG